MMEGTIEINRLSMYACHGVLPQERIVGNLFELWITLRYDIEEAARTDDVSLALDYAAVVDVARSVMEKPSQLLENLVVRLRDAICGKFPQVTGGEVKVAKVTPPITAKMESVSVSVRW